MGWFYPRWVGYSQDPRSFSTDPCRPMSPWRFPSCLGWARCFYPVHVNDYNLPWCLPYRCGSRQNTHPGQTGSCIRPLSKYTYEVILQHTTNDMVLTNIQFETKKGNLTTFEFQFHIMCSSTIFWCVTKGWYSPHKFVTPINWTNCFNINKMCWKNLMRSFCKRAEKPWWKRNDYITSLLERGWV